MENDTVLYRDDEICLDIRDFLWHNHSDLTLMPATVAGFALIYSLFITLGVVGNLLVIVSVLQNKSLQSVRNIFIVSLSCSDIVVSIVSGSVTPITAFSKIWLFGPQLCYLVPLIQGTSLCFSTLTLTAIAIDRFILIIFPARSPITQTHAIRMVAFNVALAASLTMPMVIKQRLVGYADFCGEFCTEDWGDDSMARSAYGTIVFIIQFIIPLIIICFCYSAISIKLGRGMLLRDVESAMTEQRQAALKRRVSVFFCCWLPSVAFNFLRDYSWLPEFVRLQEYLFGVITHCISMSSTVWNPCLYALLNEQFRVAFVQLLRSLRGERENRRRCSRLMSTTYIDHHSVRNDKKHGKMLRPDHL